MQDGNSDAARPCRVPQRCSKGKLLLRTVQQRLGLHDLAIEDTLRAHQRPKLEIYGDSLFIVLRDAIGFGLGLTEFAVAPAQIREPWLTDDRLCPGLTAAAGKHAGRFFAIRFRSLFCNADDGEKLLFSAALTPQ